MEKELNLSKKMVSRLIIDGLQCGVSNNDDDIRAFDIVDYYEITKVKPKTLYDSVVHDSEDFTDEEKMLFHSFVVKSSYDSKLKIDELMNVKHKVLIDDVEKVITDDEKNSVINYLKHKKIPVTNNTYYIILKRYLYNGLDLQSIYDDENKKVKKLVR